MLSHISVNDHTPEHMEHNRLILRIIVENAKLFARVRIACGGEAGKCPSVRLATSQPESNLED
jgi:hypothetical protein